MLANLINEAIILIASILSLVVILNCESILDSHFSIKSGVAFMVVADVLFFVLSASPVGLNIAIIVLAILSVKFRKVNTATITFLTFVIGAWLAQAIRLLSHATGFKLGQISYTAAFIAATIVTMVANLTICRERKAADSTEEEFEDEDEDEDESENKGGFKAGLTGLFKAYPVQSFAAIFGTVAVAAFIVAMVVVK